MAIGICGKLRDDGFAQLNRVVQRLAFTNFDVLDLLKAIRLWTLVMVKSRRATLEVNFLTTAD
jgi:hypothetical protein